jgi:hypothetical protein
MGDGLRDMTMKEMISKNSFIFALATIVLAFSAFFGLKDYVASAGSNGDSTFGVLENSTPTLTNFGSYTQDFNTLPNSGTSLSASTLPTGWSFIKGGGGSTYAASNGDSSSQNIYSFGPKSNTDRALGSIDGKSSQIQTFGVTFTNNTGGTIKDLEISYTGEQWRRQACEIDDLAEGPASSSSSCDRDKLIFGYSTNATTLANGTWTNVPSLNFNSPINSRSSSGALNGNSSSNRQFISGTITDVNIPDGETFILRWRGYARQCDDDDLTPSDGGSSSCSDGLAVDDFTLTPVPAGAPPETDIDSGPNEITNQTSATFTFSSPDDETATFECRLNGGAWEPCSVSKTYTGLTDGEYTFEVRASNAFGTDSTPASYTWRVDTINPIVGNASILGNISNSDPRVFTVDVTDETQLATVTVFYKVDDGEWQSAPCVLSSANTFECALPGVDPGSYVRYYVQGQDAAGNTANYPDPTTPNLYAVSDGSPIPVEGGEYNNVTLDENTVLTGNIEVDGVLYITGQVPTDGSSITLKCGATYQTDPGLESYVTGTFTKEYCAPEEFTFPVGTPDSTPALTLDGTQGGSSGVYAPVIANVTSITSYPAFLTVTTFNTPLPGTITSSSLGIHWRLEEIGGLLADLEFNYDESVVVGNENNYFALRRIGTTSSYYFDNTTMDPANDKFTVAGYTDWSGAGYSYTEWSAGLLTPTAGRTELSGNVVDSYGAGIRNASVTISGGDLLEPVTVFTNQFGSFNFGGLAAGDTYILTVNASKHEFAERTKVIYLADSLRGETFVAVPRR